MSEKEWSFIRTAAIFTWHCWSPEARATWKAREAEDARRIESFRRELQKIAGTNADINITTNGGCLEAVIEDLRFVAYEFNSAKTEEPQMVMTLLGRCSECGTETLSEPIFDLTDLGKILEKFVPFRNHDCPSLLKGTLSKIPSLKKTPVD
jgi:hypothetical protein